MRDHYDFSKMKGRKNPFLKYLKQTHNRGNTGNLLPVSKGQEENKKSGIKNN